MSVEGQPAGTLLGTVLDGRYRVEQLLGEGGMGAVYSATDLRLEKRVAVKVMARELAASHDALARFHREARVTSGLGHPHIVQVFDFSTTPSGEPFLVMEFLEGEDLDHRIRHLGRLPPASVIHIVKQVASALAATHAKAIVHRDLKPGNIYLLTVAGETDFVKVLDFGISKVRTASTKLTRTSSVMGTPNYMSPEQAKGKIEEIDERTDQWALACITWECLSGQGPFLGENVPSILFQIVHEPLPPMPKVAGLSGKVEEVLQRALAKNKADRFASIGGFVAALEEAATGATSKVVPTVPRTVQLSEPASDARLAEKSIQPTTFTQTAGELSEDDTLARVRSRAWIWAVVGATAILVVGAFLLLRSGPAPRRVTVTSPPVVTVPLATPLAPPEPAQVPVPSAAGLAPSQTPSTTGTTDRDSGKPNQPNPSGRAPEGKGGPRISVPATSEPKRARPSRQRAVPRMIEDL